MSEPQSVLILDGPTTVSSSEGGQRIEQVTPAEVAAGPLCSALVVSSSELLTVDLIDAALFNEADLLPFPGGFA